MMTAFRMFTTNSGKKINKITQIDKKHDLTNVMKEPTEA
jgi:hypothetical protein